MCEHCQNNKAWAVPLTGQKQTCQGNRYFETLPAQKKLPDCSPATQRVYHQYVSYHLCEQHMWQAKKEMANQKSSLLLKVSHLPIKEAGFRCLGIVKINPISTEEMKNNPDNDGIIRCGLPATHAEIVLEEHYFCDKHTQRFMAEKVQGNLDSLQERFTYKEERIPLSEIANMVICARKGCGKAVKGNIDNLPKGWRVIVIARGSLFEPANLMKADQDGVLCPEHFKEINNMLLDLPFKAF